MDELRRHRVAVKNGAGHSAGPWIRPGKAGEVFIPGLNAELGSLKRHPSGFRKRTICYVYVKNIGIMKAWRTREFHVNSDARGALTDSRFQRPVSVDE
jgi:hypothetical protein